ncbi:MAG: lysine 2,3-aminomutase, partial [Desulfobacterota bacterium]|nr:lysine 2,3-aminomutase [Thermodesulfobacteriota bacterium]
MKNSGPAVSVSPEDADPLGNEPAEEPPSISPALYQDLLFNTEPVRKFPSIGRIPVSQHSRRFLHEFFPGATEADWSNWHWQIRNSIVSLEQIKRIIQLTHGEYSGIVRHTSGLPLRITPYYASLISSDDPSQALRKAIVPVGEEYLVSPGEAHDPLGEEDQSPVQG